MNTLKPYLIALAVGFIVGIERENSKIGKKSLGIRTFVLISLLGAITGGFENIWISILITAFSLTMIFSSYVLQIFVKNSVVHLGLTTEIAPCCSSETNK
ncbi:MAG: MgtC/SapB family protein [Pseudobdellovibrio sp.]